MIKIEKDVEIPKKSNAGRNPIFPLKDMDVGDSFIVPNPDEVPLPTLRNRINSIITYFGKNNESKFSVRVIEGEIRVWRIK